MRFNDVGVLVETAIFSHVAASFTWLAAAFLVHKSATAALCSASTSLQRKFARQVARTMLRYIGAVARFPRVAMLDCKRPRNAFAALPIVCGRACGAIAGFERSANTRGMQMRIVRHGGMCYTVFNGRFFSKACNILTV